MTGENRGSADASTQFFHHRTEAELEELITSAKAGSNSALGRALHAFRPSLLRSAGRAISPTLRPLIGASDLVQDTFMNATKAIRGFRGSRVEEFLNWLRAILSNRLAEITRTNRSHRTGIAVVPLDAARRSGIWIDDAIASPSAALQTEEYGAMIERALARLPEREQQILTLRFAEGLSFPQMGEQLGLSEFMARTSFHRALQQIGRELRGTESC